MADRPEKEVRPEALVAELRRTGQKPVSLPELLQRLRIHPKAKRAALRLMKGLVRDGLVREVGGRYALPAPPAAGGLQGGSPGGTGGGRHGGRNGQRNGREGGGPRAPDRDAAAQAGKGLVGFFTKHRDGFGFIARMDRQGADLFVAPGDGGQAVDGDVVRFEIFPGRRGEQARIVEVVERGRRMLLGAYAARGERSFVVPVDDQLPPVVPVPETRLVRNCEMAKVWLEPGRGPLAGRVVERVLHPQAPGVEVLRSAYAHGFADVFPADVVAEAEATPDRVRREDREGRRDLTGLPLVTIDGEDARDFDDAVYVEKLPGRGYRLVVAIADVSHYVRPGRPLDAEALRRGTSVYFPGTVLPMLPERLSNGICSLNPEVERLCMVADMRFDASGTPGPADVYPAVMRSAARCTYTEVARMLDGERVPHREFLREAFVRMGELQEILGGVRRRRGSIDFDLPESRIVLGDDGKVLAIEQRPRNRAHRIVEEFMLAANEAVARWFGERDLPTIYRVHGLPDEDKLQAFLDLARAQGFEVPEAEAGPLAIADLLEKLAGHAQQRALNQLLLRAMMQAVYSPENIGHFGLAAEHYLHFTSPIRRYPDLVVHRLLRDALRGPGARRPRAGELERIAMLSSDRERAAMKSERDVSAYYAALFMADRVGERSAGTVSAVVEFGLFVSLRRWHVEGLVKVEDLGEAFELDKDGHALVAPRSGKAWRVGDEIEVVVAAADPARRRIDLVPADLVRAEGEAVSGGRGPAPARGRTRREERRPGKGRGGREERRPRKGGGAQQGSGKGKRGRR
ncbi:MAG TPA: ribonuclease R [Anaeromyxobacteraceae bacterium]|nr:ribonuclease R [Anaeromyxobacteraceae bacterium]